MGLLDQLWEGVAGIARGTPAEQLEEILKGPWINVQWLGRALEGFEEKGALDSPEVLRVLAGAVDQPLVWQALLRRPAGPALAALSALLTGQEPPRPHVRATAEALLDRLSLGADLATLPEGVRGLAETRRREQGLTLPEAAWASPWPTGKKKARKAAPPPPLAEFPERFVLGEPIPVIAPNPAQDAEVLRRMTSFNGRRSLWALTQLSDEAALREWLTLTPQTVWVYGAELELLIPRLGLKGLDKSLELVRAFPSGLAGLKDLESARVAPLMAAQLSGRPAPRTLARGWFGRFPEAGATGLVPGILGGERKAQLTALEAFRWLRRQHPGAVANALARYPKQAQEAVEAALAEGVQMPGRKPTLPEWADPKGLPCPITLDGAASLQKAALFELLQVLAVTPLDGASWLEPIRAGFTAESLQRLARALFFAWLGAGAPPKDRWALYASAHFPGAALADTLAEMAAELAPKGLSARAQEMVEVLAAMQTRESLERVHQLGKRVRSKAFRARAQLAFVSAAEKMGLSEDELAERLVPDFGLTPDGWLPVTPRVRLVVKKLKATFVDEAGKPVKTLPAAADPDDDAQVKELKRKAGALLKEAAERLERRMTFGRTMSLEHFTELYLMHGLLRPLAEGLVWARFENGEPAGTFTVGPDGPVDVEGRKVTPREGQLGVVHPLQLGGAERRAWEKRGLDAPFPQLGREVTALSRVGELGRALEALAGVVVPVGAVLRLEKLGWMRGPEIGRGCYVSYGRELGPLGRLEVEFNPGIYLGDPMGSGDQTIHPVLVQLRDEAPPQLLSELERELREALTTPVRAR